MIWVDRVAKKISQRHLPLEWVDDMKTPSGRIHVGSLRGVVIHDLIYKVLQENKINSRFSYVFNDMDPMDGLPIYLDQKKYLPEMGKPLYKIPSPDGKAPSYADYFAEEFIRVFRSLNCHPIIIRSSQLHRQGKMNQIIKTLLDNVKKIRAIYKKVAKADKGDQWFPYNPICRRCGKIGTTDVYRWDGRFVYYRCLPNKVIWAQGCGHQDKVEPINENGKLVWKVDWPAHWKAIRITIESSGKDHMSKGGSYDIASHIVKEILKYDPPEAFGGYEWFTVGGRKMSSSKGVGSSSKEVADLLPPGLLRFLFVRSPITTHIDFHPNLATISRLFDDYDRCLASYFDRQENRLPQGKSGEVTADFARIIELSAVSPLPKKRLFIPRFRTIVSLLKNHRQDITSFFNHQKKDQLTNNEKSLLEERLTYAKKLLKNEELSENELAQSLSSHFKLNTNQKLFLKQLATRLKTLTDPNRDQIQTAVFNTLKQGNFQPKEAFRGFYQVLIGQDSGPKAADLILAIGINQTIVRFEKNPN